MIHIIDFIVSEKDLDEFIEKNYEELKEILISEKELEEMKQKAWEDTSIRLGHGKDRDDLRAVYVIEDPEKILDIF